MAALFASGRVVDLILAVILIEGVGIGIYRAITGRGIPFLDLWVSLASGAALLLALQAALIGAWWGWIALALLGAFAANLIDLRRRWR